MRVSSWPLAAALVAVLATSSVAQPADVPALAKLVETQPADMDRSTWKERRRDAARRLGASKDKRAVPVLIRIAETETFDIIGEIAIEGLGNLGDPSAAPILQKISADNTRDRSTRELAKQALAKLPARSSTPAPPPPGSTGPVVGSPSDQGTTSTIPPPTRTFEGVVGAGTPPTDAEPTLGTSDGASADRFGVGVGAAPAVPTGPALPDDTLAAFDRLTFALGTAALSYDTVRRRPAFDADVAGRWSKRIERERLAWGVDAGAHVVGAFINPPTDEKTVGAQVTVDGTGEVRFYRGTVYGLGKLALGTQLDYVSVSDDMGNQLKDLRTHLDLQIALGGGYGRVLDVGGAIRVRRLARTLDAARALGRQIDPATARRLQLAWWALRRERSAYPALVHTVAILREAGILLAEPDAGLAYEILTVLRDTQLYVRPSGLDVQVAFGEGYLVRPDMDPTPTQSGRVEQLLLHAGYGKQLEDDRSELSGNAFARLRLFAPTEGMNPQPAPWAIGATGRFRRFTYGEHGDPFGALDLGATASLSSDGCVGMNCDSQTAVRIEAEIGFTLWLNQASGVRAAGTIAQDSGELFFGLELSAAYAFLDGTFARQ